MNRYKKLLQNTGLITLGTFGSKLLPFLLMRLYTAALSDGDYNTADIVTQTAKLLIPFAALGLTEGLFRLAMEGNRSLKKKVFTAGFLIFGGGFVLLVPLLFVAYLILKGYGISFSRYIFLIGLYVLASCLHSLVTQYIRTKDHFFFFSLQGVVNTVLVAVLNIVFYATGHFGVEEYVLSVALADFATFLLVFLKERLWRDLVPPRKIEKEVYSVMIRYSAPLIPMAVSWWITAVSDRYMVRLFVADPNMADYYSAAYKIPTLVTLLCSIFSQAWSYSSVKENDEKERSRFFSKVFSTYFGLLFLMAAFLVAFSKVLTALMMAKSYRPAWEYIPILTGATVFSSLVTFMGSVYTVRMKSTFSMWTSLVGSEPPVDSRANRLGKDGRHGRYGCRCCHLDQLFCRVPDPGAYGQTLCALQPALLFVGRELCSALLADSVDDLLGPAVPFSVDPPAGDFCRTVPAFRRQDSL